MKPKLPLLIERTYPRISAIAVFVAVCSSGMGTIISKELHEEFATILNVSAIHRTPTMWPATRTIRQCLKRAQAIVAWLTQHGIVGARLTAKGFGKTWPIADNSTDTGRAKNRRVEIADPNCTANTK